MVFWGFHGTPLMHYVPYQLSVNDVLMKILSDKSKNFTHRL